MKKLLSLTLALVVIGAGIFAFTAAPRKAHAQAAQSSILVLQWESLGVAAGAVITSPVFTIDRAKECVIGADNSAGGVSRALNIQWLGADGVTIVYQQVVTVTNATRALVQLGSFSPAASAPAGVTVIPAAPGRQMLIQLASAGAAAGSLVMYCR